MSLHVQVKIDVILHSTESIDKVFDSFLDNFGLEQNDFQIQNLMGHFDNPITLLSINLKKKDAELFITNLIGNISRSDLDKIYENIEENLSSSGLKLKISKQKMIDGKIILANSDAIKINISCPVYVKKDSKRIYQQLFQLGK
jgi:RNA binding exosome subunit|tara:strand:+ start:1963 stop:2391 length:429 start_codon:yes stop_codon:yes gene_type:complete